MSLREGGENICYCMTLPASEKPDKTKLCAVGSLSPSACPCVCVCVCVCEREREREGGRDRKAEVRQILRSTKY